VDIIEVWVLYAYLESWETATVFSSDVISSKPCVGPGSTQLQIFLQREEEM
jgi:hypothetical protein